MKANFSEIANTSIYPRSNRRKRGDKNNNKPKRTKLRPAKWKFLQHNGPFFPPPFQPLPETIKFVYDNKRIKLSPQSEEAATLYVKTTKKQKDEVFDANFFNDWRELMTEEEKSKITNWNLCNFRRIYNYIHHKRKLENRCEIKRKKRQEKNALLKEQHGFCNIDGVQHEINNFKIDTGLFLARGDHPKRGKIKKKITAEDVTINCSEDSEIPKPPFGESWKNVVHDNSGVWLAKWSDSILNKPYYITLKPPSKSKEEQEKFNTAEKLDGIITTVRNKYLQGMKSEEMSVRQRSVALYLIDHLGFRTGFDKYEDEADTVGCCSLRVQHLKLRKNTVIFDFLGKSSVRYYNEVVVDQLVFNNLQQFRQYGKEPEDNIFDCITASQLNQYLNEIMPGLTAKVFRTYNASRLFQKFLDVFTDPDSLADEKVRCYNCANAVIALLLNHRATTKECTDFQVNNARREVYGLLEELEEFPDGSVCYQSVKVRRLLHNLKELLTEKTLLLNTSKVNYLDPKITVTWCEKNDIDLRRVYTETQMKNFKWAIDEEDKTFSIRRAMTTLLYGPPKKKM